MRHLASFVILLLFTFQSSLAANRERSTIRFSLSDGYPLTLNINNRDYKKAGRFVTIGDIPRKRQNVRIYRYRAFADGRGGKAELVFSGNIKVDPGSTYECIVDVNSGKARLIKVNPSKLDKNKGNNAVFNPEKDKPISAAEDKNNSTRENFEIELPKTIDKKLLPLKESMDKAESDFEKLKRAKQFISQNDLKSEDIQSICSWFFFDDAKLECAKYAYDKVSDSNNYELISTSFTLASTKNSFMEFLKQKK